MKTMKKLKELLDQLKAGAHPNTINCVGKDWHSFIVGIGKNHTAEIRIHKDDFAELSRQLMMSEDINFTVREGCAGQQNSIAVTTVDTFQDQMFIEDNEGRSVEMSEFDLYDALNDWLEKALEKQRYAKLERQLR